MLTALIHSAKAPFAGNLAYSLQELLCHFQGTAGTDPDACNLTGARSDYKNFAGSKPAGFSQLAHCSSSCRRQGKLRTRRSLHPP
ncbi:hypothetical protein D3C75_1094200 [compost metagenome]